MNILVHFAFQEGIKIKRFSAPWLGVLAAAASSLLVAGCTIVTVPDDSRFDLHAGILRVKPAVGANVMIYRTIGIGLVPGVNGVTLAARSETIAMLYPPAGCQILLFEPRLAEVATLAALLASAGIETRQFCFMGVKRK